jgi:RHS repeat-associated protein
MGYSFTAEPENASPTKPLASPKTHTPLPRVEERGLRFYSANLSRWLSRDPIGEEGGVNVYAFCAGQPVNMWDILGLDWEVLRKGGHSAPANCCNDDVVTLAREIGLNASEFREWLVPVAGSRMPDSETEKISHGEYLIPNLIVAYWGDRNDWSELFWKSYFEWYSSIYYLKRLGFQVEERTHVDRSPVDVLGKMLEQRSRAKILHGVYFLGHGLPGQLFSEPYGPRRISDRVLNSEGLRLRYKMGFGILFACYTDSLRGHFSTSPSVVFEGKSGIWNSTPPFYVMYWIQPGDQRTRSGRDAP